MSQNSVLEDGFWKFLVSLEELTEKKELILFCSSLGLDEAKLTKYSEFLREHKIEAHFDHQYIYPLKAKCKIKMEFNLSEWFALQANFPDDCASSGDAPYFPLYRQQIIQNKIKMAQKAFEQFSLHKKTEGHVNNINHYLNLKKQIDYSICHCKTIRLEFLSQKECSIFPHRMVFLDGVLCLVGESVQDKALVYFGVEDIGSISDMDLPYEANLSQIEVSEFIEHLRLINGKEERLVLKFYTQDQTDLLPAYHYLGNPFVSAGTDGDLIWAATLEMCDDVFHWLYTMRDRVEVLDPGHVRKEFSHYCELKKQIKKAS